MKAFTIWCIFYVRREDENEKRFVSATISQPLDNYPQFAYDNNMLNHQVRQQPDRMSRGISRQTVNISYIIYGYSFENRILRISLQKVPPNKKYFSLI